MTWSIKGSELLTWDVSVCKGASGHGSSGEVVILEYRTQLPACSVIHINIKRTCLKSRGLVYEAGIATN